LLCVRSDYRVRDGYYYPPYIGPVYYYPRPVTYGFHVGYNPYMGWGWAFTYSTGFVTFGMSWHSHYYPHPPYGAPYHRPPYHGYWGRQGIARFLHTLVRLPLDRQEWRKRFRQGEYLRPVSNTGRNASPSPSTRDAGTKMTPRWEQ